MRFSIIIATLNRAEELLVMLKSLKQQQFNDFEVIVVDQNKENFLETTVLEFRPYMTIHHIRTLAKGVSYARNIGLKAAKGEIITFPDDDCEYPSDLLFLINDHFIANSEDGIVINTMDKNDGKAIANLASKEIAIERDNVLKTVIEAGIFIKSKLSQGVFFNEDLGVGSPSGYWSDEGPDFVLKLLQKGAKMKFYPDFKMYHPNPVKVYNDKTSLRAYNYGKGRGYFLKINNFGIPQIGYYLFLYSLGMAKGIVFFNQKMFEYFKNGFKGRYEGYFYSKQ
ncbi:glycosyltransferase family 2 protein [Gelidibacter salicanalis]|uniref:Glycosyltransferase family 2 protein n=1 Tax=Gelidibacter salicanalis TaxID=291193 RepID=A0A5C7AKX2_9FLAO|nr:glycosyltransferase family 2 protein [Gelidibacter salicanalis]TXE08459.1 glycosyltransferase family 2 protein [Gelidibacter salicanalis]